MSGRNSILFDIDSIIDRKLSVIKFIKTYYKGQQLPDFNVDKINLSLDELKFERMHGVMDLFKAILKSKDNQDRSNEILDRLWTNNLDKIVDNNCIVYTSMTHLLSAYKYAGQGVISTTIRIDSKEDNNLIADYLKYTKTVVSGRRELNTTRYGRIIVGDYHSALKYVLKEPKNIQILNYRENFTPGDCTLFPPELVINLGDIHALEIIPAYREQEITDIVG